MQVTAGWASWPKVQVPTHDVSCRTLALEVKNAKVMWPVRIAVSGRAVTPGGAVEICRILGRDETLRRIDAGIAKLEG